MSCILCLGLPAPAWPQSFPRSGLRTLDGAPFLLPDDLAGRVNILVIGFTQKAGGNTRPWVERLEKDFAAADGYAVYPVAVLAGVPALFRPLALGSIRGGIPPEKRSTFLIVENDEQVWRDLAGYRFPDVPCIVVLDRSGSVFLRTAGLFDEARYQEIASVLRR